MIDNCKKCGRFLGKNDIVLCNKCKKIYSEWLQRNRGKYSTEENKGIMKAWFNGEPLP